MLNVVVFSGFAAKARNKSGEGRNSEIGERDDLRLTGWFASFQWRAVVCPSDVIVLEHARVRRLVRGRRHREQIQRLHISSQVGGGGELLASCESAW